VNKVILGILHKVLDLLDYGTVVDELIDPLNDAETLIEFILYVRQPSIYLFWRYCSLPDRRFAMTAFPILAFQMPTEEPGV
jgi:hypothetical protein